VSGGILEQRSLIGIDLGATNVRVGRIYQDKVEQLEAEAIVDSDDPSDLVNQIAQLIRKVDNGRVESIGMGVPSVVDVEEGIVYDVQNIPAWKMVPVKRIFEEKFDRPVYVNNDANCFVLGERFFGQGRGYHSIVGLTLGSGLGSGLILDDRLYSGENCGAGEVGMFPYKDSIFEHYCGGMFFEREFGVSGKKVFEKMKNGETDAKIMYEAFGTHLGNGIKTVMYAYDPQIIILGGTIRKAYPYFKDAMYASMEDFAYPNSLESLKIEVSELDNVSVLGAAVLSLDLQEAN
jgi:glucokinase